MTRAIANPTNPPDLLQRLQVALLVRLRGIESVGSAGLRPRVRALHLQREPPRLGVGWGRRKDHQIGRPLLDPSPPGRRGRSLRAQRHPVALRVEQKPQPPELAHHAILLRRLPLPPRGPLSRPLAPRPSTRSASHACYSDLPRVRSSARLCPPVILPEKVAGSLSAARPFHFFGLFSAPPRRFTSAWRPRRKP